MSARLFLSYSTQDTQTAEHIRQGLLAQRPDLDIYLAPKRNELGAYWIERLERELAAADAIILLISRRIGPWQELEYYDALRRNRSSGRPQIIPILLADTAPGLPFFDQFHRLSLSEVDFDDLIDLSLHALDGIISKSQSPPWRHTNPYPGLPAMGTQDAAYFFGRETLSGQILTRLEQFPDWIHMLIGNSGVGKSSLAMAGVLAALRSRLWPGDWNREWPAALTHSHTWPIVIMKPGQEPVKALTQSFAALWLESPAEIEAEALKWRSLLLGESSLNALVEAALRQISLQAEAEQPQRLILYIDQGEELYSHSINDEASRFSKLLADAVVHPNLLVMLSLRSDYYGYLQADNALFKAAKPIDVPPLNQIEIERIIRLPAQRLQVRFENPDIIALIAEATARQPGALPMLSDLLSDAWRVMAEADDADGLLRFPFHIVDISRPLADKAERFFASHLNLQEDLKRLFTLKLAHVTKEGEVVRHRARRSDCNDTEWSLIETMVARDWRLLSVGMDGGEPVAEVAHEALLRNWPRLGHWLDESREFLIWKSQLEPERIIWQEADATERSRALLTGLKLDKALHWQKIRNNDLTPVETQFISDSAQAAARNARQRFWVQRSLWALLLISVVTATFAFRQRNAAMEAEQQALAHRDRAEQQAQLAIARRLAMAAEKVFDENIGETTLAGLLAVESLNRTHTLDGQRVLRRILQLTPGDFQEVKTPWPQSKILHSPDGKLTAFSRLRADGSYWKPAAGMVAAINTQSWQVTHDYPQDGRIWPVISGNGQWLVMAGYGRRLWIVNLRTHQRVLDVHQDDMIDVAFGSDDQLYVARTDGVIEVRVAPQWNMERTLTYPLKGNRLSTVKIEINPNGRQLLIYGQTADKDQLNPWLISLNGKALTALGNKSAISARYHPSGNQVATVSWDNQLQIWDTATGAALATYQHDARISTFTYSTDGKQIISAIRTGNIIIRDATNGKIQKQLSHDAWVNAIASSANGRYLASASDDRTAALWDLDTGEKLLSLPHDDEVWTVKFGDKDRTIITGDKNGALHIFETLTGKQVQRVNFAHGITAIAHNTSSHTLAVGMRATEHEQAWADVILVDHQTGHQLAQFEHNGGFNIMKFSPDSRILATTTGGNGDVKLWDAFTGTLMAAPELQATALFFSPDSSRLIAGHPNRETIIADTSDGKRLAAIGEPGGIVSVNIAADKRTFTTFGKDKFFRNWDAISGKELWHKLSDRPEYDNPEISADGRRYVVLSADRKHAEILELHTGQVISKIPAGRNPLLLLSEDGQRLLITRSHLSSSNDPTHKYSEIELWHIDASKLLLRKRYEQSFIRSQLIPGNRFAIIANRLSKHESEGVLHIISADQGNLLWSLPIPAGFSNVLATKPRNDLLIVDTGRTRQIREIDTGRLTAEITGSGILAVAVVEDENLLQIANRQSLHTFDNAIEIRNIDTGQLIHKIPVLEIIHDLAVSTNKTLLFAAVKNDYGQGVRIWRRADWSEIGYFTMDSLPKTLFPLPDPDMLAVQDNSGTLRVWQISTGSELHRFSHTFTAEGTRMATTANRALTWQGASLRLWNIDSGEEIAWQLSHGKISSLAISPDASMAAYLTESRRLAKRGGDYHALVVWEPDSEDNPVVLPMQEPRQVQFDPSGRYLVVLLSDKSIQILDAATLRASGNIYALPGAKINNVSFSTDGKLLFVNESQSRNRGLRIFLLDSAHEIARIDDSIMTTSAPASDHAITRKLRDQWRAWKPSSSGADELLWKTAFDGLQPIPNSTQLLEYSTSKGIEWFDLNSRKRKTIVPAMDEQFLRSIAIDAERKRIAVALDQFGSDKHTGRVLIYDLENGKEIAQLQSGISISAMAFVDEGNAIIMSDTPGVAKKTSDSILWLWQWRQDELLTLSQDNPINTFAVTVFATAEGIHDHDNDAPLGVFRVQIWNTLTGKVSQQLIQEDAVHDVAFSPDGLFLAVKMTRRIIVYQTETWQPIKEFSLEGTVRYGGQIDFALDNWIIVSGQEKAIRIWSLDDNEQRILRHSTNFSRFSLSGDRRWLATEDGGKLRVWSIETGQEFFQAKISVNSRISSFAFSGANGDILVANVDRRLLRIPWQTEELIALACHRFARSMMADEWQRFFDQEPYQKTCD